MRVCSHLTLSECRIFHFRYPLPRQPTAGSRRYVKVSLRTRNPKEALQLSALLSYAGHQFLHSPEIKRMDYQQIRTALTRHFSDLLERTKLSVDQHGQYSDERKTSLENSHALAADALEYADYSIIGKDTELNQLIATQQLPIQRNTPAYDMLRAEYLKALRDYCTSALDYNAAQDGYSFGGGAGVAMPQQVGAKAPSHALTLKGRFYSASASGMVEVFEYIYSTTGSSYHREDALYPTSVCNIYRKAA